MHIPRSVLLIPLILALPACVDSGETEEEVREPPDRATVDERSPSSPDVERSQRPAALDPAAICDTINNSFRCARAIEERALPGSRVAERHGDTLVLELADGDTARLVDRPGEGGDVVHFSYQDHWPDRGYVVIQQQYYEGSEYLLVDDQTGARTTVPERPLPAPGGDRFAVLSFDLEAGYGPNTLQIWQFTAEGPRMEWETNPDTWGPTEGRWAGPHRLEFTRACPAVPDDATECGGRATVERSGSDWILEAG